MCERRDRRVQRGACAHGRRRRSPSWATTSTRSWIPADPELPTLEAAVRLARLLALASLREREVEIDPSVISAALSGIREQLDAIRQLKTQLTSISNATKGVWTGLDQLRASILTKVVEAEAELRVAS